MIAPISPEDLQRRQAAALQREALQQMGAALVGWGTLIVRAAYASSASELLEVVRGARNALLAAIEEAKDLAEIEGESP